MLRGCSQIMSCLEGAKSDFSGRGKGRFWQKMILNDGVGKEFMLYLVQEQL